MRTSSELKVLQDSAKRWRGLNVLAGAVGLLSLTAVMGAYLAVLNGALPLGDWMSNPQGPNERGCRLAQRRRRAAERQQDERWQGDRDQADCEQDGPLESHITDGPRSARLG